MHEGAENLAMQFYRIELAEQRRLTGIMHHHSKEDAGAPAGDAQPSSAPFPYSITAGVEKGAKNRYRNIWPFEHARVRLQRRVSNDDDYINASYVQPLGTHKRYIATQGPLPATFNDFWAYVTYSQPKGHSLTWCADSFGSRTCTLSSCSLAKSKARWLSAATTGPMVSMAVFVYA
jgi:protein tyrosine phosphatase